MATGPLCRGARLHLPRSVGFRSVSTSVDVQRRAHEAIALVDAQRPVASFLTDSFNRKHDYLRISLTERCNLRCFYCMPENGVELSPRSHILADDEVIRLATLFVQQGVSKIRLTGGEPTLRNTLPSIMYRLGQLRSMGLKTIAMTSNGISLNRRLPELVDSGLTHLNLSLDTLDPLKFELMTRRPAAGQGLVLSTLDTALSLPRLQCVKLNAVIIRGLNDDEVGAFVELTRDRPIVIRFIEYMPFNGNKWQKNKMVSSAELLQRIQTMYPALSRNMDGDHDTSRTWRVPGYAGSVGFISSMSDHFCGSCNRLRLTADGQIKVCLFDAKEVSLRDIVRSGASDEQLLGVIGRAVGAKKAKHAASVFGLGSCTRVRQPHVPPFLMSQQPPFLAFRGTRLHSMNPAKTSQTQLTHMSPDGRPQMVDVSKKDITQRSATARGRIILPGHAFALITRPNDVEGPALAKGDPLAVAQLAGIMAAKRTSDLIPLCHPALPITHTDVVLTPDATTNSVYCEATIGCVGRTGVEMEALTAVSVALLTVWDMIKAVAGREMVIEDVQVVRKEGGKSGAWSRDD